MNRLFNYLSDKALEYATKSEVQDNYKSLKKELTLRFDLRDEPVAARQILQLVKQMEEESLEEYLQRVLTIAMDGFYGAGAATLQQLSTEAFLRGCKHKEAIAFVFNQTPKIIQKTCKRVKTFIPNKKLILGGKEVTFQEKVFTLNGEQRVHKFERKLDDLIRFVRRNSLPHREQIGRKLG